MLSRHGEYNVLNRYKEYTVLSRHGEYNVLNRYKEKPALSRYREYSVSHRCKEYIVLSRHGRGSVRRRERNVSGTAWGLLFETAVGFFLEAVRFIICLFMVFTAEFSF